MAIADDVATACAAPVGLTSYNNTFAVPRFFRWSGAPPQMVFPSAGADVDGVSINSGAPTAGHIALPGLPFKVEAGGAFAAGASLATDSSGRAVAWVGGQVAVARALQAAGAAGAVVWAVFTSGR